MKKTTLVAPYDDPLALAVAGEARLLGRSLAALLPGNGAPGGKRKHRSEEPAAGSAPAGPESPADKPIDWNPPSFVSARTAVLEAAVRYGSVDEAVLVVSIVTAPGLAAKPAEMEKFLHDRVLSFVWLSRELLSIYSTRAPGSVPGRLVLVLADRGLAPPDPVSAAAFGALSSFASSLAETTADAPYDVWAVQDSCPQDDLAAQYISRILAAPPDRRGGRVLRFTGKGGIFNRI